MTDTTQKVKNVFASQQHLQEGYTDICIYLEPELASYLRENSEDENIQALLKKTKSIFSSFNATVSGVYKHHDFFTVTLESNELISLMNQLIKSDKKQTIHQEVEAIFRGYPPKVKGPK